MLKYVLSVLLCLSCTFALHGEGKKRSFPEYSIELPGNYERMPFTQIKNVKLKIVYINSQGNLNKKVSTVRGWITSEGTAACMVHRLKQCGLGRWILMDAIIKGWKQQKGIQNRKVVKRGSIDLKKGKTPYFIAMHTDKNAKLQHANYIIASKGSLYCLHFITTQDAFSVYKHSFEKAVKSFAVKR